MQSKTKLMNHPITHLKPRPTPHNFPEALRDLIYHFIRKTASRISDKDFVTSELNNFVRARSELLSHVILATLIPKDVPSLNVMLYASS